MKPGDMNNERNVLLMKSVVTFCPLLVLVIMAGIILLLASGGINDLTFWVLTIPIIVLATLVGIYRYVNKQ